MPTIFNSTQNNKKRLQFGTARRDIFMSFCILSACSFIGLVFFFFRLSEANIISIYILGILLIASITSSWIYGAAASIIGVFLFNCLYAEPIFNFYVYDWQYVITIFVMLIASLIVNYVMTLFRRHLDSEKLENQRLDILFETNQHLQQAREENDIFHVALIQLHQMFGRTILLFPLEDNRLLQPMIKSSEKNADFFPEDWGLNEQIWRQFIHSDTEAKNSLVRAFNGKKAIFFQVRVAKEVFAVAGIIADSDKSIMGFERKLVLAILDEVALSLEKHRLHLCNERIAREAEAERTRANLLRTISHDLRTPLTSISGNADILLSNGDQIQPDLRRQLYQNIHSDSEWLINLVENLLFVTRIDNGAMSIHAEPEVLQEILPEALNCIANLGKEHNISLELPDELLVVKIEARLFMQVIINIVHNAIKYSPAGSDIKIRAFQHSSQAIVEVEDTGCGINDEDKLKVFEMFYTANKKSGDSRRGIGLGLSLCQSIVRAHGSAIHIADNAPNGTVVSFALHLEETGLEHEYPGNRG